MSALELLFRLFFVLHGLVRFYECQSLSAIREILCVHSGHVDGRIQNEVGKDLEEHALGIYGGLREKMESLGKSHKTISIPMAGQLPRRAAV